MLRTASAAAILLFAGALRANETVAAGTPLALAANARVQGELKLSAVQAKAVSHLYAAATKDEKTAALDSLKKELKPEQMARLREISLQVRGGSALADADIVKELKLTAAQQKQVADLWKNHEEDLRQILRITRFRDAAARRKFVLSHRVDAGKDLVKVLTEEQAAAFKKMQGAAFETKGLDR